MIHSSTRTPRPSYPDLYKKTLAAQASALSFQKRWIGIPYMPAHYADTVYEHMASTKKTDWALLESRISDPDVKDMLAVTEYMIDMHDLPEIYGEILKGSHEKKLRQKNIDLYPVEIKTFRYAFLASEQAVHTGDARPFFHELEEIKEYMAAQADKEAAHDDTDEAVRLFNILDCYLDERIAQKTETRQASNIDFGLHHFKTIEHDETRRTSFVASRAKVLEKNDAYVHMGKVYARMAAESNFIYTRVRNTDILNSVSRSAMFLPDMMNIAQGNALHTDIAADTLRFVYQTAQDYLRFGPAFIDLDDVNPSVQPDSKAGDEAHDTYQAQLKKKYNAQDSDRPETHRIVHRRDIMLRLEAAKKSLIMPHPSHIYIDQCDAPDDYWQHYQTVKRNDLFADLVNGP